MGLPKYLQMARVTCGAKTAYESAEVAQSVADQIKAGLGEFRRVYHCDGDTGCGLWHLTSKPQADPAWRAPTKADWDELAAVEQERAERKARAVTRDTRRASFRYGA